MPVFVPLGYHPICTRVFPTTRTILSLFLFFLVACQLLAVFLRATRLTHRKRRGVFVGFVLRRDMITAAVGDADSSVRATARRAYWVLRLRFPDLAESVMGSLAPSMQVGTCCCSTCVVGLFGSRINTVGFARFFPWLPALVYLCRNGGILLGGGAEPTVVSNLILEWSPAPRLTPCNGSRVAGSSRGIVVANLLQCFVRGGILMSFMNAECGVFLSWSVFCF